MILDVVYKLVCYGGDMREGEEVWMMLFEVGSIFILEIIKDEGVGKEFFDIVGVDIF